MSLCIQHLSLFHWFCSASRSLNDICCFDPPQYSISAFPSCPGFTRATSSGSRVVTPAPGDVIGADFCGASELGGSDVRDKMEMG